MSDVFGIDLGTTYSAIGYLNENGLPQVIRNPEGTDTTPSVVYFESNRNCVVGQVAKNGAVLEPDLTVSLIKRFMGREYNAEYHGESFTPESISSMILKELVSFAREATRIDSTKVVITVPAYFGIAEKEATRQAGTIAGLDVIGIVTEPVAAALSYGYNHGFSETLFVYDLGGGTFDTTVMRMEGEQIEVVVIDGNRELGGADWDGRLIQRLADKFRSQAGLEEDPLDDDDFRQKLTDDAEQAKKALSSKEATQVVLGYGAAREKVDITRQEFEDLTNDLLEATMAKVQATLDAAKAKDPDLTVDTVLLVGGASNMPVVRRTLSERFGWDPKLADPHLAVAKGAAIYGAAPRTTRPAPPPEPDGDRPLRLPPSNVKNVLPRGLGVLFWDDDTETDYVGFLMHKNTSLPERVTVEASTAQENATAVAIRIFEQGGETESKSPADNIEVTPSEGAVFTNLPSLRMGSPIAISLEIDGEGLATLEAKEPVTGQQLHLEVQMAVMQRDGEERAAKLVAQYTTSG